MDRRNFLKLILVAFILPKLSNSKEVKRTKLSYTVKLPFEEEVRLWVPVPVDTDYQRLLSVEVRTSASYYDIKRDKVYHAPILYAEFKDGAKSKELEVIFDVEYHSRSTDLDKLPKNNNTIPKDVALFLKPTEHIPTDGIQRIYVSSGRGKRKTFGQV